MNNLPVQPLTLCIIREGNKILLAMKKRGFGTGKWNGYGGKLQNEETIENALLRELKEESTLDAVEYEKRGEMVFSFPDIIRHVHIYEITSYNGTPEETDEMKPEWFHLDDIPFQNMWESDTAWFPYFLKRIPFEGSAVFNDKQVLLSSEIKEI